MAGNRVQPECGMRCKGFRADAVRNRRRVLAAALSMDRIARLAGVSDATLHRHYDGRQELWADVADGIAATVSAADPQAPEVILSRHCGAFCRCWRVSGWLPCSACRIGPPAKVVVSADGSGVVSHAGSRAWISAEKNECSY